MNPSTRTFYLPLLSPALEANLGLSGTGQDVSIMRSTLLQTGIIEDIESEPRINLNPADVNVRHMLHTIQEFIVDAGVEGEQNLSVLYERLTSYEYGIGLKLGVIPIYLAAVLQLHRNNIVIKKGPVEQKLSSELLNMINEAPQSYSLILEDWNADKTHYLAQLEKIFHQHIHEQERIYNSFSYIVSAMCRWYMSLPKYTKEMTKTYMGTETTLPFRNLPTSRKRFLNSLKQLDINPRAYLFEKIFEIYGYPEFNVGVVDNIARTKIEFDEAVESLLEVLINDVKLIFAPKGLARGSLTSIIQDWYAGLKETTVQHMFAQNENKILSLMQSITNDEKTFIQRIAKAVTALRVEDWNDKTITSFIEDLKAFKETIEAFNNQSVQSTAAGNSYKLITVTGDGQEVVKTFSRCEYSRRAELLYNDIINSIDEMGQSVSVQEVRQILFDILGEL